MHVKQFVSHIPIREQERRCIIIGLTVAPTWGRLTDAGDAQPMNHTRVYLAFFEEKALCFGIENRLTEEPCEIFRIWRMNLRYFFDALSLRENDVPSVGSPLAGVYD